MPEPDVLVLVWCIADNDDDCELEFEPFADTAYRCKFTGKWEPFTYEGRKIHITHWMPLPEPPK
jgi:hypothetical protein